MQFQKSHNILGIDSENVMTFLEYDAFLVLFLMRQKMTLKMAKNKIFVILDCQKGIKYFLAHFSL